MNIIITKLTKAYNNAASSYKESPNFGKLLSDQLKASSQSTFKVFPSIKLIRDELKFNKQDVSFIKFLCN